jgi:hypothetical protein
VLKQAERAGDHLSLFIAEIKNEWSYPPLHGVYKKKLAFAFTSDECQGQAAALLRRIREVAF